MFPAFESITVSHPKLSPKAINYQPTWEQQDDGFPRRFQINEDGAWKTYYLPGATIIDKRTVNYGINDKWGPSAKPVAAVYV